MLCFRVGDIKSATVSSQLTKMKTAKMKKMQVVSLLFLPFNCDTFQLCHITTVNFIEETGTVNTSNMFIGKVASLSAVYLEWFMCVATVSAIDGP